MAETQTQEVVLKSKELFYRGKNLEELKTLDVREVAKFLPARSRRSVIRNFQFHENFVKRCEIAVKAKKKIKTHLRDIVVVPKLVGMRIGIYNGKTFHDIEITHKMIGMRLGEFSLSRGKVTHGKPGMGSTKSSSGDKK